MAMNNKPASNNSNDTAVQAEYWINIGLMVGDSFVELPYGLAIDTMKDRAHSNNSTPEWIARCAESNEVRNSIKEMMSGLKPGQKMHFECGDSGLVMELSRREMKSHTPTTVRKIPRLTLPS